MSGEEEPREADYQEVNLRLNQGLQTCRSVVANYRTLLTSHDADAANDDDPGASESARPASED